MINLHTSQRYLTRNLSTIGPQFSTKVGAAAPCPLDPDIGRTTGHVAALQPTLVVHYSKQHALGESDETKRNPRPNRRRTRAIPSAPVLKQSDWRGHNHRGARRAECGARRTRWPSEFRRPWRPGHLRDKGDYVAKVNEMAKALCSDFATDAGRRLLRSISVLTQAGRRDAHFTRSAATWPFCAYWWFKGRRSPVRNWRGAEQTPTSCWAGSSMAAARRSMSLVGESGTQLPGLGFLSPLMPTQPLGWFRSSRSPDVSTA